MTVRDLPVLARALLAVTLPSDWRDDIVRDLEEAWSARRSRSGPVRAAAWLGAQAVGFSLRFLPERAREVAAMSTASVDLKLAVRSALRTPLVTVLAVAWLAVGIGAALGGYTLLRGALFTELPVPGGDRIWLLQDYDRRNRYAVDVGPAEFLRRRSALHSFEHVAAFVGRSVSVGGEASAATVQRALIGTPELLRMAGVAPSLGRLPDDGDVMPGAEPVVVLPHAAWVRLTGSDPGAVGSRLTVGGVQRTVIGVMPAGFGFPYSGELWIPFDVRDADGPVRMIGKLREGVEPRHARAELAAVARPDPTQVEADADVLHLLVKVTRPLNDTNGAFLAVIPIAVLVLLLVVMATNVANLVLARNATRAPELAVRSALGATRARVVRQLVAEVGVLVLMAAGIGVVLARLTVRTVESRLASELPFWVDFALEPSAVAFTVALAALVTLVAGVAPALRATRTVLGDGLRDGARGASGVRFGRLTGALIVVQVAISVGFLSAATLLGQSLLSFGFDRYGLPGEETLVAQIYFGWPDELQDPDAALPAAERERIRAAFMAGTTRTREAIRERMLALPGVRRAAYGSRFPGNESEREHVEIEGSGEPPRPAETADIDAAYLDLLGAPVVEGRGFTVEERPGASPVVLVNEPFVRDRLGGGPALGRRIRTVRAAANGSEGQPWATIVGVVPDLGLNPGNPSNAAAVYRPLGDINIVRLAIRGDGEPGALAPRLLEITREADPDARVQWSKTLEAQMSEPVLLFRWLGIGFLVLGSLALLLAGASIHALTACAVTRRAREIGVRQALGAGSARIVRAILRRSTAQLLLGSLLGGGLALALLRLASVFPWEVRQGNPGALALVVAAILLAGTSALAQPLGRALRVRPADAMRAE